MSDTMTQTPARTLVLNAADNIAVALANLDVGTPTPQGVAIIRRVPRGHKFATRPIGAGEAVIKFGQIIGFAREAIAPGDWVHEHNCGMGAGDGSIARDYGFSEGLTPTEFVPVEQRATFEGYRRANGKVGTRNYIGILTSVNCSATVAKFMAEAINRSGILAQYPEIDGVIPFVHGTGCAMDIAGEGYQIFRRTQWGYTANPNLGAALLVGLGCEAFQIDKMKESYNLKETDTFQTMTIQEIGGTRKMIDWGVERIKEMLPIAARARRETVDASELTLALQCGGSDGYSGITANPALGVCGRHSGAPGRHGDPERNAGNLRRRAFADPPRQHAGGGRKADRAHPLVGGLHPSQSAAR